MIRAEKLDFCEQCDEIDAILRQYRILSIVPMFGAIVYDQDVILTYDDEYPATHDTHQFERHIRCYPLVGTLNFFSEIIQEYCIIVSRQYFLAKISAIKMVYIDYMQPRSLSKYLRDQYYAFSQELDSFMDAARAGDEGPQENDRF